MRTEKVPETGQVISRMLKENTGKHLLDSGSFYGRHWERNQEIDDFEETEEYEVEADEYGIMVTTNVYHFLKGHLEYTEKAHELTLKFKEFAEKEENKDAPYLALMEEWANGDAVNTYNHETHLSQVLQFVPFGVEPTTGERSGEIYGNFVILQIHNGCDVRGGYTDPVVFETDVGMFLSNMSDLSAYCEKCGNSWWSDDAGYSFYPDSMDGKELETEVEDEKVIHKGCGGEVEIYPHLQY